MGRLWRWVAFAAALCFACLALLNSRILTTLNLEPHEPVISVQTRQPWARQSLSAQTDAATAPPTSSSVDTKSGAATLRPPGSSSVHRGEELVAYFGLLLGNTTPHAAAGFANDDATWASPEQFCADRSRVAWQRLLRDATPELAGALRRMRERHDAVARGTPEPGQKYLVWSLSGGLGNRFQSLVSTFLAALISERVLLMKDWFTPLPPAGTKQTPVILPSPRTSDYFLEDLSKFDLVADEEAARSHNRELLCPLLPMMALRDFRALYPHEFDRSSAATTVRTSDPRSHVEHAKVDVAAKHDRTLRRWNRFLCTNMTTPVEYTPALNGGALAAPGWSVRAVAPPHRGSPSAASEGDPMRFFFPERFVYVWTNQYFLPAFYANPFHNAQMRAWFPDDRPYRTLVRALVLPSQPVARAVRAFFTAHAIAPLTYDALQIRAFQDSTIAPLAHAFAQCLGPRQAVQAAASPVFLASQHAAARAIILKHYAGEGQVHVNAPPREAQVTGNAQHDQEALTDMMLLALGRTLHASRGSTFGSFVAAFTDVPTVVVGLDKRDASKVYCTPLTRTEPCFASWVWYDAIPRRGAGKLTCKLAAIPENAMSC